MPDTAFHFAQPMWLWGLLVVPLVLLWLSRTSPFRRRGHEERYADAQLLPYLSGEAITHTTGSRRPLLAWVLAWCLLLLAMAGPRWGFRQMNPFEAGADLVILLDISRSMNVMDVAPARLERARHEIQDLVEAKQGIRVGLIAFATVAHVVTPITEDGESLLRQLPAISTDLVRLQGSRLGEALAQADRLLAGQGEEVSHNVLLISDGDFADPEVVQRVKELYSRGIHLHVLAVGTSEGGPVPEMRQANGQPVISALDIQGLEQLAKSGGGLFQVADYREDDTDELVDVILSRARIRQDEETHTLVWNEQFHWMLLPAMLILLLLYRPGGGISRFGSSHIGNRGGVE